VGQHERHIDPMTRAVVTGHVEIIGEQKENMFTCFEGPFKEPS
jgi:hypothetical protein